MRTLTAVMIMLFLTAVGSPTGASTGPIPGAGIKTQRQIVITVKGMMCASCGKEIDKTLRKVPGVLSVTVDVPGDRVTITYDETVTHPRQLSEAIRKAGYEAVLPAETRPLPPVR